MKRQKCSKRLLGIIGGMGPVADALFLSKLHKLTLAECDQAHIPVLYDGNCLRPDRSDFLTCRSKADPFYSLRASLKFLERSGADVIAMPCNTAHAWIKALNRAKRRSTLLINMCYETVLACQKLGMRDVCLLATPGTYRADVYGKYFFEMGIDCVFPEKSVRRDIRTLILQIKSGKNVSLSEIESSLGKITCDGFILGCTELSLAYQNTESTQYKYVDSLTALAEKAVTVFGKKLTEK